MSNRIFFLGFLFLSCISFLSGCNQTFEPLEENDKYFFSIFGYLDASADTQWVRISPARERLSAPPEVPEMKVTLENVGTGHSVVMKDSLFGVGSGFSYINFYTMADIEPGETYLVKAERPDGRASQAVLSTPGDYPTPRLLKDTSFWTDEHIYQIVINGVERLVDVQTWWFVKIKTAEGVELKRFTFSYKDRVEWVETYGGAYVAEFIYEQEQAEIMDSPTIRLAPNAQVDFLHQQVYVAAAGPEWNEDIPSLDDLLYSRSELLSNVDNGLGYMVGVYSKVIPYETCEDETGWLIACEEEEPFW